MRNLVNLFSLLCVLLLAGTQHVYASPHIIKVDCVSGNNTQNLIRALEKA